MDVYKVMKDRRSIRAYKPDAVPEAALERIFRAAQVTPSWKNRQAWHIIAVDERETIAKLGKAIAGNPRGVDYSILPMVLVLAMDADAIDVYDGKEYYLVDAGIVGEHIVLAAQAEGLGTCWVGWFSETPVKEILGIPDRYRVVMITPLGYPAEAPHMRPRKPIDETVHRNRW